MNITHTENRRDILHILPKNAVCAELGCMKGDFSWYILNITRPQRFFMIDPYWKAYGDFFYGKNKRSTVASFNKAIEKVRSLDNYNVVTFVIEYDTVFLHDYPDHFFDWVYIDTTHSYEDTIKEMNLLKHKVKQDGFICGHDYKSKRKDHAGLTVALHEWLNMHQEYEFSYIDNHTQWIIKHK